MWIRKLRLRLARWLIGDMTVVLNCEYRGLAIKGREPSMIEGNIVHVHIL